MDNTTECTTCGAKFERNTKGRPAKRCAECRRRNRQKAPPRPTHCGWCSKPLEVDRFAVGPIRMFCNKNCANMAGRKRRREQGAVY